MTAPHKRAYRANPRSATSLPAPKVGYRPHHTVRRRCSAHRARHMAAITESPAVATGRGAKIRESADGAEVRKLRVGGSLVVCCARDPDLPVLLLRRRRHLRAPT